MTNSAAPVGKETKYARHEYERRFLLSGPPREEVVQRVEILDRYLTGTRIRLRRAVTAFVDADDSTSFKLTQKLPRPDGRPGLLTTFYLNESEYETFSRLPGDELRKTRLRIPPLSVDCFEGHHQGLYLAEAEFDDPGAMTEFAPPAWVVAEVTDDARFRGGQLVSGTRDALRRALAEYGITLGA